MGHCPTKLSVPSARPTCQPSYFDIQSEDAAGCHLSDFFSLRVVFIELSTEKDEDKSIIDWICLSLALDLLTVDLPVYYLTSSNGHQPPLQMGQ